MSSKRKESAQAFTFFRGWNRQAQLSEDGVQHSWLRVKEKRLDGRRSQDVLVDGKDVLSQNSTKCKPHFRRGISGY